MPDKPPPDRKLSQLKLSQVKERAFAAVNEAGSLKELEASRVEYLGRKGKLTSILRSLKDMTAEERRDAGRRANRLKVELEELIDRRRKELSTAGGSQSLDLTLPGRRRFTGCRHPLTIVTEVMMEVFTGMGFEEVLGPEIETEWYNFEALNIPQGHPARGEMFGNFYLEGGGLLRSHTSPVQIRIMENRPPPVRIVAPGRVYRRDSFDASHSPVFHQIEGLYVDRGVSFADLKGTLITFVKIMFGEEARVKFSPSYFPFTEPSAELSISCVVCAGEGCSTCGNTGWVEVLGCGMVHPQVLRNVGYDPDKVTGFAFGIGIDRIAMIYYGIDDIRHFFTNDLRFLRQFHEV